MLGLTKEATDAELSKAYRRLSRDYHPDKQDGKEDKLKELQTAWETLGDAVKRKSYDTYGVQQVRRYASFSVTFGGTFDGTLGHFF